MKCPHIHQEEERHTHKTYPGMHTHIMLLYDLLAALLTGTDEKPHQTQRKLCFERIDLFQDLLKLGIWQKKKQNRIF